MKQIQQGDVLLERVNALPKDAKKAKSGVLAEGEATGHAHRLDLSHADVFVAEDGALYVRASAPSILSHEEHHAITVEPGTWRVWRVREVDPFSEGVRRVAD